jgi:hypothetical protein
MFVIADDSAYPKRCFYIETVSPTGQVQKRKICITWFQLPTIFWRFMKPDPAPHSIEYVDDKLLNEVMVIDSICWFAHQLDKKSATRTTFIDAAEKLLGGINDKLQQSHASLVQTSK